MVDLAKQLSLCVQNVGSFESTAPSFFKLVERRSIDP